MNNNTKFKLGQTVKTIDGKIGKVVNADIGTVEILIPGKGIVYGPAREFIACEPKE